MILVTLITINTTTTQTKTIAHRSRSIAPPPRLPRSDGVFRMAGQVTRSPQYNDIVRRTRRRMASLPSSYSIRPQPTAWRRSDYGTRRDGLHLCAFRVVLHAASSQCDLARRITLALPRRRQTRSRSRSRSSALGTPQRRIVITLKISASSMPRAAPASAHRCRSRSSNPLPSPTWLLCALSALSFSPKVSLMST